MDRKTGQIRRAAQLYYEQDLNQQAISETMGVSRASVSRLLTEARARGVVTITLDLPVELDSQLSEQVRTAFGLRDAVIVTAGHDLDDALSRVGQAAADFVEGILQPNQVIAMSWGRTLAHMVDSIEARNIDGIEVVQMIGSLGEGDPKIDGPDLARRFAQRFGGSYRYINAPAVMKTPELCRELKIQTQVAETLRRAERADICITSVGALHDPESSLERNGYLTTAERVRFAALGAVGHLLARLISINGEEFEDFNGRVLAIDLARLQDREWSICIGSSRPKGEALVGAIRAGCANTVIADAPAALRMLELA